MHIYSIPKSILVTLLELYSFCVWQYLELPGRLDGLSLLWWRLQIVTSWYTYLFTIGYSHLSKSLDEIEWPKQSIIFIIVWLNFQNNTYSGTPYDSKKKNNKSKRESEMRQCQSIQAALEHKMIPCTHIPVLKHVTCTKSGQFVSFCRLHLCTT